MAIPAPGLNILSIGHRRAPRPDRCIL